MQRPLEPMALLRRLQAWDDARDSLPGEHAITAAVGVSLLLAEPRLPIARAALMLTGIALLVRAAMGRDGLLAWLERQAPDVADSEFVEVAATYPYEERVRVSRPKRVRPEPTPAAS